MKLSPLLIATTYGCNPTGFRLSKDGPKELDRRIDLTKHSKPYNVSEYRESRHYKPDVVSTLWTLQGVDRIYNRFCDPYAPKEPKNFFGFPIHNRFESETLPEIRDCVSYWGCNSKCDDNCADHGFNFNALQDCDDYWKGKLYNEKRKSHII